MAAVALLTLGAARRPRDPRALVLASLGAVAAFATFGKVLSPQYLVWMLPLGALALAWRRWALAGVVGAATLLTFVEFPSRYFELVADRPLPLAIVAVRDCLLVGVVALAMREVAPVRRPAAELLDRRRAARVVGLDQHAVQPGVLDGGLELDRHLRHETAHASSFCTPITPPRGPVMPTSVM